MMHFLLYLLLGSGLARPFGDASSEIPYYLLQEGMSPSIVKSVYAVFGVRVCAVTSSGAPFSSERRCIYDFTNGHSASFVGGKLLENSR